MATATRKKRTVAKRTTAKRTVAKRTGAKKTAAVKKTGNGNGSANGGAQKIAERYSEQSAQARDLAAKYDGDVGKVAKAAGWSVGKAQRMIALGTLKPSDRIITAGREDKDIAKDVVRLRDEEGLAFMPDIWARTGLSPSRIQSLYKLGGGKGRATTNGNGKSKSTAKTTAKRTTRKASARKAGGSRKSGSGTAAKS